MLIRHQIQVRVAHVIVIELGATQAVPVALALVLQNRQPELRGDNTICTNNGELK